MSQSDFISTKKTRAVLRSNKEIDPVLSSQLYTTLKSYTLERNLIKNCSQKPKTVYNRMALPDKVFFQNVETHFPKTCENDLRTFLIGRKIGSCQNCSSTSRNPFNEYKNKLKQMSYDTPDAEIIQKYTENEFCKCDVYFSAKDQRKTRKPVD